MNAHSFAALLCAVAIPVATPTRSASAQSVAAMFASDVRNTFGDAWDIWTAPLRGRRSDWLLAAGTLAAPAAVLPWDDNIDRWAARNRANRSYDFLKPLREGGAAFSGRTITPIAAGALLVGLIVRNEQLQDGLFGCLTAYGASSVVRSFVIYPLVARTRPDSGRASTSPPARSGDQYHFDVPGSADWGRHSFPGGHDANVAACAAFVTRRFSLGALEPLPWILVGGVALGRTLDRRHWASDEVVGTLFGYAVGKEIALRSSRRATKSPTRVGANDEDRGEPFVAPDALGLRIGWRRQF